ncbi:hypothetical protein ACN083_02920 [Rothia sp. CCM 9418]|uniref:hypothetical protein n=1 Tax=Rothia sp. CCM 9418 TaxID=3402661 RepID=UPI003AE79D28
MTEHNAEEQKDSVEDSYLFESFVTEDGIEVPPPTRPMGPRRLARYRIDAAAYLRALRDGTELPEEPVAYMPATKVSSPETSISDEALSVQQRFSALAEQGDIRAHDDLNGEQFTGENDTRADVGVIAATPGEEVSSLPSEGEQEDTPDASTHAVSASDYSFDDELVSVEDFDDSKTTDALVADVDEPSLSDALSESTSEDEVEEYREEPILPKPVAAVDAHGLDLESCDYHLSEDVSSAGEEDSLVQQTEDSNTSIPWEGTLSSSAQEASADSAGAEETALTLEDTVESEEEESFVGVLPLARKDTSSEPTNFADDVASIAQKTAKGQEALSQSSVVEQETLSIREQLAASSAEHHHDASSPVNVEDSENVDYSAPENAESEVESSSKIWLFIVLALVLVAVIAVWFVFFQ